MLFKSCTTIRARCYVVRIYYRPFSYHPTIIYVCVRACVYSSHIAYTKWCSIQPYFLYVNLDIVLVETTNGVIHLGVGLDCIVPNNFIISYNIYTRCVHKTRDSKQEVVLERFAPSPLGQKKKKTKGLGADPRHRMKKISSNIHFDRERKTRRGTFLFAFKSFRAFVFCRSKVRRDSLKWLILANFCQNIGSTIKPQRLLRLSSVKFAFPTRSCDKDAPLFYALYVFHFLRS